MNILITGGAGYVGYSLVKYLLNSPIESQIENIIIYDNLSRRNYNLFFGEGLNKHKIRFVQGELLDSRKIRENLQGVDILIHLAAKVTTPYADLDSHFFEQINHWGTAELVNTVETSQHQLKHFINLSSISVYGSLEEEIDENSIPQPTSFYGISKLRAERHIHRLQEQMKVHIIRSGNVYGYNPCMRTDAVINRFMFEANFNQRVSIHGDGSQTRAFIHVEKLAYLLAQLLVQELESGTYPLVEHNFSVNDISHTLLELYPQLERIYINQHIQMRSVKVKTPCKIVESIPLPQKSFLEELDEFKAHFSFF